MYDFKKKVNLLLFQFLCIQTVPIILATSREHPIHIIDTVLPVNNDVNPYIEKNPEHKDNEIAENSVKK